MDLLIRLATVEDTESLQELIRASVAKLSDGYYTSQEIASGLSHIFGVDTQLILDGTYFVAEVDREIVGSGGWSKRRTLFGGDQFKRDGVDDLLDPETEPARIRAFYVHPNWSRKGIGSRILQACEDGARSGGFRSVELVSTLPGEPLYSAKGYEKREEMRLETPDGESLMAFKMTKNL